MIEYNGIRVGSSLRGFAKLERKVINESGMRRELSVVTPPLRIITYDTVSFPSHQDSYVSEETVVSENASGLALGITKQEVTGILNENSANFNLVQDFLNEELHDNALYMTDLGTRVVMDSRQG